MQRLSVFLFTSILGRKIYDEFDDVLGELKDIYVTTEQGYPRVIGYKVKRDGVTFHYEFRSILFYNDDNKVKIMTRGSKEILPRTYSYLLSRNLLDKKIVDINGKQVVRVDDLRIAEIAGEYRVIAVETGPLAKFRRMNCPGLGKFVYKVLNKDTFNIKESDIHKVSLQGQIKYTDSESSISTFTDNFSFIDENTLLIVEKYRISDLFNGPIPVDEFNLEVKLNSIEIIMVDEIDSTNKTKEYNGSWEFEVPVKKDLSESKNIDIKNIITDGTSIEDIELTPYELKITVKRDKNLPKAIVTFKDNNGNEIENISGHRINDETIIQTLNLPNVNAEYLVGYIKYVDEIHNDTCISCNDDNTHSHEIEMEEKIYLNN